MPVRKDKNRIKRSCRSASKSAVPRLLLCIVPNAGADYHCYYRPWEDDLLQEKVGNSLCHYYIRQCHFNILNWSAIFFSLASFFGGRQIVGNIVVWKHCSTSKDRIKVKSFHALGKSRYGDTLEPRYNTHSGLHSDISVITEQPYNEGLIHRKYT